jgi:hypothetical protein
MPVVLAVVLCLATPAHAAFTLYTTEASFLAAAPGPVTTETFDEFPEVGLQGRVAFLEQAQYLGTSNVFLACGTPSDHPPFIAPSQPTLVVQQNAGPLGIAFVGSPTQSLGFYVVSPVAATSSAPADYRVTQYEAGVPVATVLMSLSNGAAGYVGFVETTGSPGIIEAVVTYTVDPEDRAYNFGIDDVSQGPITRGGRLYPVYDPGYVPEPSSMVLLGLGLAGVIGYAWRHRWTMLA